MCIHRTTVALFSSIIMAACGGEDVGKSALGAVDGSVEEGEGKGEGKVTLCHVPPGNPDNAHTITVGEAAVSAHLDHHGGDHLGPCGDDGAGGSLGAGGNQGAGGASSNCPGDGGTAGSSPCDCDDGLDDCHYGEDGCDCLIE